MKLLIGENGSGQLSPKMYGLIMRLSTGDYLIEEMTTNKDLVFRLRERFTKGLEEEKIHVEWGK